MKRTPGKPQSRSEARDKTGIRDCTIVTWDDEDESDGIRIVPVWKWLLA